MRTCWELFTELRRAAHKNAHAHFLKDFVRLSKNSESFPHKTTPRSLTFFYITPMIFTQKSLIVIRTSHKWPEDFPHESNGIYEELLQKDLNLMNLCPQLLCELLFEVLWTSYIHPEAYAYLQKSWELHTKAIITSKTLLNTLRTYWLEYFP